MMCHINFMYTFISGVLGSPGKMGKYKLLQIQVLVITVPRAALFWLL